jgi:hypothetical protein
LFFAQASFNFTNLLLVFLLTKNFVESFFFIIFAVSLEKKMKQRGRRGSIVCGTAWTSKLLLDFLLLVLLLVLLPSSFVFPSVSGQKCSLSGSSSSSSFSIPAECRPFNKKTSFFLPPESLNLTLKDINRLATIATLSLAPLENSCR